jgi:hypothetical protein
MSTSSAPIEAKPSPTPSPAISGFATVLVMVCGIVLPTITILVEALLHMCAEAFFDPLPTVGHVFALATVPLAGVFSLRTLWRGDGAQIDAAVFAQAFAVAVAAVYALIFAPMTPVSVLAIAFVGLGLLPLSPLLSLFAGLSALSALRRQRAALRRPARRIAWTGFAAGIATLVALNIPALLTRVMLVRAASDDPAVSRSGVTWLRRIGQQDRRTPPAPA